MHTNWPATLVGTARFNMGHPTALKFIENRMSPALGQSMGRGTRDEKSTQAIPVESFGPLLPYEHIICVYVNVGK